MVEAQLQLEGSVSRRLKFVPHDTSNLAGDASICGLPKPSPDIVAEACRKRKPAMAPEQGVYTNENQVSMETCFMLLYALFQYTPTKIKYQWRHALFQCCENLHYKSINDLPISARLKNKHRLLLAHSRNHTTSHHLLRPYEECLYE